MLENLKNRVQHAIRERNADDLLNLLQECATARLRVIHLYAGNYLTVGDYNDNLKEINNIEFEIQEHLEYKFL